MDRIGEMVICSPQVKIQKGEQVSFIDMEKLKPLYKYVTGDSVPFEGQSGAKFENGDTLMARITPCLQNGKISQCVIHGKGYGSTEFFVFRGKKDITDNEYVYYLMNTQYVKLLAENSMTGASGRQRADMTFIKRIKWEFPDITTQRKIADALSMYDRLIDVNLKKITSIEATIDEIYKEWFVRYRFPGSKTHYEENELPEGWERAKLSKFYLTSSGGTPSRDCDDYYVDGTIPWIKTGELRDCVLINTEEAITDEAVKHSSAKLIPPNSVLMAMYGVNIGMLAYTSIEATCNQACCVFRDKKKFSTKHYLFQYLKSIRDYLLLIGFGAAQQNLSQDLIKNVKIIMPTDKVLQEFEAVIEPYYQMIQVLLKENNNLVERRELLLQRLMSGQIKI